MARFPKPWFRKDRQSWFVTLGGERHNLGPDKSEAFRRFHNLMAAPAAPRCAQAPGPAADALAVLCDRFLGWVEKHLSADTYRWYKDRLQAFIDHIPKGLPAKDLKLVFDTTNPHLSTS